MGAVLTRGWWSRVRGLDAGGAGQLSGQPRLVRAQDALPSSTLDFHLLVTEGASAADTGPPGGPSHQEGVLLGGHLL